MHIKNLFNNLEHEINTLHIYDGNGVIFSTDIMFEPHKIENNKYTSDSAKGGIIKVDLGEIRSARKIDFAKHDCFFFKRPVEYSFECNRDLYIHTNFINCEYTGEFLASDLKHEKCFHDVYKITIKRAEYRFHNFERIPLKDGEKYAIPENWQHSDTCYGSIENPCWSNYTISDNLLSFSKLKGRENEHGIIKRWFTHEIIDNVEMFINSRGYSRIECDDFRNNAKTLTQEINDKRIFYKEVSFYEIERLLENYNITKKGV